MPKRKLLHVGVRFACTHARLQVKVRFKRELLAPHYVVNPNPEWLAQLSDIVSRRSFSGDGWVDSCALNGWLYHTEISFWVDEGKERPHNGGL